MKRYGMLVGLKAEAFEEYKRYHAAVWPEVLATIERCHIRNYTIYHHAGQLFASYEYHGTDHAADMAKMGEDAATQRWWAIMNPMQTRIEGTPEGDWWMPMEEMFHFDGPKPVLEPEPKSENFLAG
jgi:L-rhamnose mutarotase